MDDIATAILRSSSIRGASLDGMTSRVFKAKAPTISADALQRDRSQRRNRRIYCMEFKHSIVDLIPDHRGEHEKEHAWQ